MPLWNSTTPVCAYAGPKKWAPPPLPRRAGGLAGPGRVCHLADLARPVSVLHWNFSKVNVALPVDPAGSWACPAGEACPL